MSDNSASQNYKMSCEACYGKGEVGVYKWNSMNKPNAQPASQIICPRCRGTGKM